MRRTTRSQGSGSSETAGPSAAAARRASLALVLVCVIVGSCGGTTLPTASPTLAPTSQLAPSPAISSVPPQPSLAARPSALETPSATPSASVTVGPDGIALIRSDAPLIPESAGAASDAARAINSFGVDLYRRVSAGSGNVVISPASVAIALDMARAGAQGETAVQMDAVLHATGSADAQATAVGSLDQALAALNGTFQDLMGNDLPVALRIANAPFAQIGMAIAPAYLDAVATRFGAPLRLVDYVRDPNAARLLINAWVKAQTEGRIPDLLAPPDVSTLTRLVLVNAIYLHAPWLLPFDPKLTAPGTFTRADASQVEVPMMTTHAFWPYAAGNGWKAVELPYLGGSLALDVILPDDLASFEAHLASTELTHITGALKPGPLEFTLPRFHIQTEVRLADALKTLGTPLAFGQRRADFSGIALRLSVPDWRPGTPQHGL
jgi:serpin B